MVEQAGFLRRRVAGPVWQLLRIGATPERLAWSITLGLVIGVNPLLGSTTMLTLAAASGLRLNQVASQLANHLAYPLELLLFPVFVRVGIALFRTERLPWEFHALVRAVKLHPWDTTLLLWRWEWHALVVWAGTAIVVAPLLQWLLRAVLKKMLAELHDEPVIEK